MKKLLTVLLTILLLLFGSYLYINYKQNHPTIITQENLFNNSKLISKLPNDKIASIVLVVDQNQQYSQAEYEEILAIANIDKYPVHIIDISQFPYQFGADKIAGTEDDLPIVETGLLGKVFAGSFPNQLPAAFLIQSGVVVEEGIGCGNYENSLGSFLHYLR